MNFIQIQSHVGFWSGAIIIIMSFHNLFISEMLYMYKARQTNTSNILKIIFQFCLNYAFGSKFRSLYDTKNSYTYTQCDALLGTIIVGNIIRRLSLSAFLIWLLGQIRNDGFHDLVCCFVDSFTPISYSASGIAVEFLIDIFVTFRLLFWTLIYVLLEVESITIKNIVYIALSHVITADAEIVRVIEGKDSSSGSTETEKPLSSTHSQIENDKIAIASMKI
ncbi:unnamed protein product [Rhizophagus irregularis]|nr:unnamed protein product [Rhizophagus irregularis]